MYDLAFWTRDDPAAAFDLTVPEQYLTLAERYSGARPAIFRAVVGNAIDLGCKGAVAEYRYLDADYRSEHSHFYSTTFRRYPSVAHRLHFFRDRIPDAAMDAQKPSSFEQYGYRGYAVLRPVPASTVGRTVMDPPDDLAAHVSCRTRDEVNLYGSTLEVRGAPFMSQDSQLGVCVHATAWTCAHYHHLEFGAERVLPAEIAKAVPPASGRLVPSPPMSVEQLSTVLDGIGLPPIVYDLGALPGEESIATIACRYLNSGLPVIAAGGGHAFVLVGYRHALHPDGTRRIEFIRHDDQDAPYVVVGDPTHDHYRPWEYLVVPLPAKIYVSAEKAEAIGRGRIFEALHSHDTAETGEVRDALAHEAVAFRTHAVRSNEYKSSLRGSDRPEQLVGAYQWMHMSRWIWVVEAVNVAAWDAGDPCVVAEAIIDATDHTEDPQPLAWRVPGLLAHWLPDTPQYGRLPLEPVPLLSSTVRGSPALVEIT